MSKEREYYKAARRAAAAVNSTADIKNRLDSVVRNIARTMNAAVSLVLLDAGGTKLVHTSSRGLPQFYRKKGVLDAAKSMTEVITGKPVVIADVTNDDRIQFPEMAVKAGITSALGIPVIAGERCIGGIRVYTRERYDFTPQDTVFVTTMANLIALALRDYAPLQEGSDPLKQPGQAERSLLTKTRSVVFAHPSEEEFAGILDFYNIEWVYEPRSFPLSWEGETVTEMFTPDFYLPAIDLYIELTTVKQQLLAEKHRKLKLLKERYPEVKVTLLYKTDYDRLLAKYGFGPLAQTRAHGIDQVLYSATEINERVKALAAQISRDYQGRRPVLIGVQRGFICFMADLIRQITIPVDIDFMAISYYTGLSKSSVKVTKDIVVSITGRDVIMVEDIVDTGITLSSILKHLQSFGPAGLAVCTLLDRPARRLAEVNLAYIGFEIPDKFVVGYGLDYREEYRNLPFIGIPVIESAVENTGTAGKE
ncbi:MAG: hypoxanthine phosphoribosyltransferase [Dehalococcoidales bacterium]|nr:hypoxanthine phosphoribosyltransferase [Dehalococcoidales bacterium]